MGRGLSKVRQTLQGKRKRTLSRAASQGAQRSRSRSRPASQGPVYGDEDWEWDDNFGEDPTETIADTDVLDKYRLSGSIATAVLKELCDLVVPGASVLELCKKGDEMIATRTAKHYTQVFDDNGDPLARGVAFPTCVNVKNIVCHYQPSHEREDVFINEGDVVRVELGVHIDGYINTACHTVICKEEETQLGVEEQISVDVLAAAYTAAAAALRLMKPGGSNHDVTEMLRSVAHSYGVDPAQGVLSHRMKRWDEQGQHIILGCTSLEDHMLQETVIFQPGQVWSLDIVFMNGSDNKLRSKAVTASDHFIFKRSEVMNNQRIKSARYVLSALREQGSQCTMPFTTNTFDDPLKAKAGICQLVKQQLLDVIPVLWCKPFQTVARYKWTVIISEKGVQRLAGLPPPSYVPVTTDRITRDVAEILRSSVRVDGDEKKKKKLTAKRQKKPTKMLTDAEE